MSQNTKMGGHFPGKNLTTRFLKLEWNFMQLRRKICSRKK